MTTAADNPFSPPKAEVKDATPARLIAERPQPVVRATALAWCGLAIGMAGALFQSRVVEESLTFVIVTWTVALLLGIAVNIAMWRGRNWARILKAVFAILSVLLFPFVSDTRTAISGTTEIVAFLFDLAVLYLVFTKPGSLWFKYTREPRMAG